MTLSPLSTPFFSCSSFSQICKRDFFICKAKESLSKFDFNLFCEVLDEWESCSTLSSCFSLPLSTPFFSCSSFSQIYKRNFFLCKAKESLSKFDFNLFCEVLDEWESCSTLSSCFSLWNNYSPAIEN